MAKIKVLKDGLKCERCGHEWVPRKKLLSEVRLCPKCKTAYWDKPRPSLKRLSELEEDLDI
jgi:predicted Zn-ribbon and HTH transcriptional regulator